MIRSQAATMDGTVALVLAGGRGERLRPLTERRAKSAVPIGGAHRLIDLTLANAWHSSVSRVGILVQYQAPSLTQHLWSVWGQVWGKRMSILPPPPHGGPEGYQGTADAVSQQWPWVAESNPSEVLILASDHVYRLDYRRLLAFHRDCGAEVTVACTEIDAADASRFGVMQTDSTARIRAFAEKPATADGWHCRPGRVLASMGIYVFSRSVLPEALGGRADFGHAVIPWLVEQGRPVYGYNAASGDAGFYWRDVGDVGAYWQASMDWLSDEGCRGLFDGSWPIAPAHGSPPEQESCSPTSRVTQSLVCPGSKVSRAVVHRSIVSPGAVVEAYAEVIECVLLAGARVGEGAQLYRTIIEEGATVGRGERVNPNRAGDRGARLALTQGVAIRM